MISDDRVKAIRAHLLVGEGSLTSIDECFSDAELVAMLDRDGIETPEAAVQRAIEFEDVKHEQALNPRWGEDDDPQKKEYDAWKKAREEP